jgi:hypothetical protein
MKRLFKRNIVGETHRGTTTYVATEDGLVWWQEGEGSWNKVWPEPFPTAKDAINAIQRLARGVAPVYLDPGL